MFHPFHSTPVIIISPLLINDILLYLCYVSDPLSTDPLSTDPLSTDPLSTDPLSSDPLSTDPLSTDPLSTDPLSTDPLSADPLSTDPLSTDPLSTDPLSTDPLSFHDTRVRGGSVDCLLIFPTPVALHRATHTFPPHRYTNPYL